MTESTKAGANDAHQKGCDRTRRNIARVEEEAQRATEESQYLLPGLLSRELGHPGAKGRRQVEGSIRGPDAISDPGSRAAGGHKHRKEEMEGIEEKRGKKRRTGNEPGASDPEHTEENMVGAFAARLMAELLELTATCGVSASMTRTADKFFFEIRLIDAARRGKKENSRDSPI